MYPTPSARRSASYFRRAVAGLVGLHLAACRGSAGETTPTDAVPLIAIVAISPIVPTLHVADTVTFSASVIGVNKSRVWTWSSSDTTVLRLISADKMQALKAGSALVQANSDGMKGVAQMTVVP